MPTTKLERACHSVHHIHELIHTAFSAAHGPAQTAIAELMPAFADDFRMVTTQGVEVNRQQVANMFQGAAGARPGLQIQVSDVQLVWEEGSGVTLRYREVHRLHGDENARWSVVAMSVTDAGVRWHFLQETAV